MDLPAPSFPELSEPRAGWRKAAIVAGVIAGIELVALIVVALAFVAKPFADEPAGVADPEPTAETQSGAAGAEPAAGEPAAEAKPAEEKPPPAAKLPRTKTGILVLNGNGISGAATSQSAVLRSLRYPVVGVGDAPMRNLPRTIVMYRAGFQGEALRLAKDLGMKPDRAMPLDGLKPSKLQGAKLLVIVGNNP